MPFMQRYYRLQLSKIIIRQDGHNYIQQNIYKTRININFFSKIRSYYQILIQKNVECIETTHIRLSDHYYHSTLIKTTTNSRNHSVL